MTANDLLVVTDRQLPLRSRGRPHMDADDAGTDWRETTALIFGIDVAADQQRARRMYDSHLARARWMTEIGYAHLLGCEEQLKR